VANSYIKNEGRVVRGSVFDCNKKTLERLLKNYDSQLYLKWNTEKRGGRGIWELRRLPDAKKPVYKGVWIDGNPISALEYVESDMIHHVFDLPSLSYRVLDRLYAADTFRTKKWVDTFEYEEERSQIKLEADARNELAYNLRHHKKELDILREAARSGINPAHFFASGWK
jgi:hypothetical protein